MPKEFGVSNRNRDSWRFQPNGKAPSFEGAFLVPATPPSGRHRGWGTGNGGGVVSEVEAGCEQITPSEIRLCVDWLHGVPGCGFLVGVGNVQNGGLTPWPASNL